MNLAVRDEVLARVLADEGGVSHVPQDRGGLTNLGLTRPFLQDVTGRVWSDAEIVALTPAVARSIYGLWLTMRRLDQLPDDGLLAWIVIDYAVISGERAAIKAVQKAIGVTADGIAGPQTQGAWHLLTAQERRRVAGEVVAARLTHIGRIVKADPTQVVFLAGWLNRLAPQVIACATVVGQFA